MPKPTSREELLRACEVEAERLGTLLARLPASVREDSETQWSIEDQSRNPRDVLAHVHAWHLLMLGWYDEGMAGRKPAIPGPGYTWRDTPALNAEIWQRHRTWSYAQALAAYLETRAACVALVDKHTDEELFTKKRYPWTGTTSLGAYLISATSAHDAWAQKTLKAILKAAALDPRGAPDPE